METTLTPITRKGYRAGAPCAAHPIVHSRPKSADRTSLKRRVLAAHGSACVYCAAPLTGTACELDRIVESCAYITSNLLPACKACNNARNRDGDAGTVATVATDLPGYRAHLEIALTLKNASKYAPWIRDEIAALLTTL